MDRTIRCGICGGNRVHVHIAQKFTGPHVYLKCACRAWKPIYPLRDRLMMQIDFGRGLAEDCARDMAEKLNREG